MKRIHQLIQVFVLPARRLAVGAVVLASIGAAHAGTVKLRVQATLPPDAPVTLGDVAELEGDDAASRAGLVLAPSAAEFAGARAWREFTIADLRTALGEQKISLSRLALSGSACTVRLAVGREPEAPAPAPPRVNGPERPDLSGPPTIRSIVSRGLLDFYGVDPESLRVAFDPRDVAFLDRVEDTRRVSIAPATTEGSARGVVRVRVFDGDRLADDRTIRADVELLRRVLVMKSDVRRKGVLGESDVNEVETWIRPGGSEPVAAIEDAAGSVARTRLEAGAVLRKDQLEPPVMIRRGELVQVHCLGERYEVDLVARAVRDGRVGELIELRVDGSKQTFAARVDGRARAVMIDEPPANRVEEEVGIGRESTPAAENQSGAENP